MNYVIYTQVDSVSGIPASAETMRNGPGVPDFIEFSFALESKYPIKNDEWPVLYGFTDHDDLPDWIEVITQQQFDADREAEMQARHMVFLERTKLQVASLRYQTETGGITLSSGSKIPTEIKDQNRIANAYAGLSAGFSDSVDFKGYNGWTETTLAELEPIARMVFRHVSVWCFGAENDVAAQLDKMDFDALKSVDVQQLFHAAYEERKANG